MPNEPLPPIVEQVREKYPQIWEAYNALGKVAADAGPLEGQTERLVKLALSVGGRLEGAVRSHVRQGLAEGVTTDVLLHVALLAITTTGWPNAIAAFSWVHDEIEKQKSK